MLKKYWPRILLAAVMLFVIGVPGMAQGPHNITLTWTAPTTGGAPTTYIILRGTTTGTEAQIATVPAPTLTFVDATGTAGTKYFYTIEASNAFGTSAPSGEVSATFLGDPPGAVGSPAATAK